MVDFSVNVGKCTGSMDVRSDIYQGWGESLLCAMNTESTQSEWMTGRYSRD